MNRLNQTESATFLINFIVLGFLQDVCAVCLPVHSIRDFIFPICKDRATQLYNIVAFVVALFLRLGRQTHSSKIYNLIAVYAQRALVATYNDKKSRQKV